jgi:hypothetical protein
VQGTVRKVLGDYNRGSLQRTGTWKWARMTDPG